MCIRDRSRSVRLYTPAQFEEVKTLVDLMAQRSDLPPAERENIAAAFLLIDGGRRQLGLHLTIWFTKLNQAAPPSLNPVYEIR